MRFWSQAKTKSELRRIFVALAASVSLLLVGCGQQSTQNAKEITVAAASNLTEAFAELAKQFTATTGIRVVYSFGSTADLARQIENGGPFDVFASADVEHIDELDRKGLVLPGSRAIYARGRLVLWIPEQGAVNINRIEDVAGADVKTIAIAKPDLAPYGRATVEALKVLNVWSQIESKVVYGTNVSITKQYAASGNANVAFIPLALVKNGEGRYIEVNDRLHNPINQALAIVKTSARLPEAWRFVDYVLGDDGRAILRQYGFNDPSSE